MLPYKVIVSNKNLNITGDSGQTEFDFVSLDDAKAFATKLTDTYDKAFVYIWEGNTLLSYFTITKNGLVMYNEFSSNQLTHPVQGSASFDGSSDYIQLNTPFSYTNHTVAAWVYAENDANTKFAFDTRDSSDDGILLSSRDTETIRYEVNGLDLESTETFANEWVYAVGTYDGTTAKLYVNGSLVVSTASSQTVSTTTDARIGTRSFSTPNKHFNGNLANVAFWNRALSSDEINAVMWKGYNELTTSEENGLQSWYSLDSTEAITGDTTADLTFYAEINNLIFEGAQCVQDAFNAFPTADPGRVLFDAYDTRVIADGGTTEARTCTINEINALL